MPADGRTVEVAAEELRWLRDVRDAAGALLGHATRKYPSQPARAEGWWAVYERLEQVWAERPHDATPGRGEERR